MVLYCTREDFAGRGRTFVDEDDVPLVPNSLTITSLGLQPTAYLTSSDAPASGSSLTLTNSNASNVFYAALRGVTGNGKVTLSATCSDGFSYTYKTSNKVTFTNGKFYDIKVKMKIVTNEVDLSKLSGPYTAQYGDVLSGETDQTVTIASGATVTLKDATIYGGIVCSGNANIILVGSNSVTGPDGMAGVQAAFGCTLTISGSGSLEASGGSNGAGIGSGYLDNCGAITISGGTVTATGGAYAAGIGSGYVGGCGDITIGSGITRVTAIKGLGADHPIGRGSNGSCGTVTVDGVEHWDGSGTANLDFTVSTSNHTWTLTHK